MADPRAEHAERLRLMEEAASAHAANARRRIKVGAAAIEITARAAGAWQLLDLGPGGALARAAGRIEDQTARLRFDVSGDSAGASGSFSGEAVGQEDEPLAISPAEVGAMLDHAGRVRDEGRQRVLGRQTTHYTAVLDVDDLVVDAGGATAERFEQQFGDTRVDLPMEVWLTDDGLPLLLRLFTRDSTGQLQLEVEALECGVPVDVEAPPAASVTESSSGP